MKPRAALPLDPSPWWFRHAAALLMAFGVLVVAGFAANVWVRLGTSHVQAVHRAFEDLDGTTAAFRALFESRLRTAQQLAALLPQPRSQAPADELGPPEASSALSGPSSLDHPGVALHSASSLAERLQRVDNALDAAARIERGQVVVLLDRGTPMDAVRGGAPSEPASLLFAWRHQRGGESLVAVFSLSEAALARDVRDVLGTRHGEALVRDSLGQVVTWISPHGFTSQSEMPAGWGAVVTRGMLPGAPSGPDPRMFVSQRAALDDGFASVATGMLEDDLLEQYIGRHAATRWLTPVMAALVLGLVGIAALAVRRFQINERAMRVLATRDPLTGLANRASFNALLTEECRLAHASGTQLGLLFLDLDNFKYINDSLGHDAGDQLLREVARRLESGVRNEDIVCRLGGDEFTVVLRYLGDVEAAGAIANDVAERILQALAQPIVVDGVELLAPASIGIALLDADAATSRDLLRCADLALYKAKSLGKSCHVRYSPALSQASAQYSRVTQDLSRGLERKEFFLVYQPKLSLADRSLVGFEALVRWRHPERGVIPPNEFIEIAEEAGLIVPLGDYVIREALTQVRAWFDAGLGWKSVAVNVSGVQLRDRHVVRTIRHWLAELQVPGQCLQVELTETTLAADLQVAAGIIKELKRQGIQVAVDDFGTGYSSLAALQRFDIDFLKVDMSFVQQLEHDAGSLEICRAIVNLAHSLNIEVIAEGIETERQLEYLQMLEADQGQGYLFDKPLAVEQATELMRKPLRSGARGVLQRVA